MAKERDERGRWVKGVTPKGAVPFNEVTAKEAGRRSQQVQREKKTIADALRVAMYEPDPDNPKQTRLDAITGGAISQMMKNKNIVEIRVLADVLGELEQKIDHTGSIELSFKFGE